VRSQPLAPFDHEIGHHKSCWLAIAEVVGFHGGFVAGLNADFVAR
jgi:hypothetical protein